MGIYYEVFGLYKAISPILLWQVNDRTLARLTGFFHYSEMQEYYVYIVRCSDGSYYTGVTNDPEQRIAEHNAGLSSKAYTFKRRPVELVYLTMFTEVDQAITWEKIVKRWRRAKKEALIRREFERLVDLSRTAGNWLVFPLQQNVRKRLRVMLSLSKHDTENSGQACRPSTSSG